MRTVAIIPAYEEAGTIGAVVEETADHVDDVVVVDDASTDETPRLAREAGATVIEHTFNIGVGGALRTGYRYAIREDYEFIVQVDADGQHDPGYIPELLDTARDADIVIGSRYLNESIREYSFVRRTGIRFFTWVVRVLGRVQITDVTSGFRVYRASRIEEVLHHSDNHWAVEQTLDAARRGMDIREVSVKMPTRKRGFSQFSLDKLVFYPIRMVDTVMRILIFR